MVDEGKFNMNCLLKEVDSNPYADSYGVSNAQFYTLVPRPQSFEIYYDKDVLWSKLKTGKYPDIVNIKHRCIKIIEAEQKPEFIRIPGRQNYFQKMRYVSLPASKGFDLESKIDPELYLTYQSSVTKMKLGNYV